MRMRLMHVGKDRSGLFDPAAQEYVQRIGHYVRFDEVVVPASARREAQVAVKEEGEALLAKLKEGETLVAFDERGRSLDSREFATLISRLNGSGRDTVFVIGGDAGLSDAVRGRAGHQVSLSKMTLPHRLARVVALEQIYRAFTILRREPYHR